MMDAGSRSHVARSAVAAGDLSYGISRFQDAFREQDKALYQFINTKDPATSEQLQKMGVISVDEAGTITIKELGKTLGNYLKDNEISLALKELKQIQLNMAKEDTIMEAGGFSAIAARVRWLALGSRENSAKEKLAALSAKYCFEINPSEIEKEGVDYLKSALRLKINLDSTRRALLRRETAPKSYVPPAPVVGEDAEIAQREKDHLEKVAISNFCTFIRDMKETEKSSKEFTTTLIQHLGNIDRIKGSGFSTKVLENYDCLACRENTPFPDSKTFLASEESSVSRTVLSNAMRATLDKTLLPKPRVVAEDARLAPALKAFKVPYATVISSPFKTAFLAFLTHMEEIKEVATEKGSLPQEAVIKTLKLLQGLDAPLAQPFSSHILTLYDRQNTNLFTSRDWITPGNREIPFNFDLLISCMQTVKKHSFKNELDMTEVESERLLNNLTFE